MENYSRRGFIGKAVGAVAAVGAIASLTAMKKTWDPLASTKAAGFTTLDMSIYKEGEMAVEKWRGKPIFVLKQTSEMLKTLTAKQKGRIVMVGDEGFLINIGICTHLGCIPAYRSQSEDFLCPCHGGMYDHSGDVIKDPPPRGFDIPPFKIDGNKLVLGEEGPEYRKMKDNGITL